MNSINPEKMFEYLQTLEYLQEHCKTYYPQVQAEQTYLERNMSSSIYSRVSRSIGDDQDNSIAFHVLKRASIRQQQ
jgi:hypothetical protein